MNGKWVKLKNQIQYIKKEFPQAMRNPPVAASKWINTPNQKSMGFLVLSAVALGLALILPVTKPWMAVQAKNNPIAPAHIPINIILLLPLISHEHHDQANRERREHRAADNLLNRHHLHYAFVVSVHEFHHCSRQDR